MDDLGHMDRQFLWRTGKASRRVHIENSVTERAFCQVENCGGKPLDGRGAEVPAGRRICENCIDLAGRNETAFQEPDLCVLMGERLAETEPKLFAVAPEPEEQEKQPQPVNKSKGRKPKRSNVKYPRPFDDDIPW